MGSVVGNSYSLTPGLYRCPIPGVFVCPPLHELNHLKANLSQSKDGASDGDIPNRSTAGDAMTTVGKLPGLLSRTTTRKFADITKLYHQKIPESKVLIATSSSSALTADGWMCAHQRREFGINKAGSKSGRGCGR